MAASLWRTGVTHSQDLAHLRSCAVRAEGRRRKLCTMPHVADIRELDVSAALLRSKAQLVRSRELPGGVWLAHWANADTRTAYLRPGHHTLSIYLEGGHAVRCHQAPSARGKPGSLCSLPSGHESHWDVNGSLQLLHLYMPTLQLAQSAERWLDMDPRFASLAEQIFFHDERLAALCTGIARLDWHDSDAVVALQQLTLDVQARLLSDHATQRRPMREIRGGLSPAARRRVIECVESRLADGVGLSDLAQAACLSDYHFARMFKASFGMSPHAWVMQRRVERARQLLAQGAMGLEMVAQQCGYAHLSHMNAALKRAGLGSASVVARATKGVARSPAP
jgi:AraC family transcriptional regulator